MGSRSSPVWMMLERYQTWSYMPHAKDLLGRAHHKDPIAQGFFEDMNSLIEFGSHHTGRESFLEGKARHSRIAPVLGFGDEAPKGRA